MILSGSISIYSVAGLTLGYFSKSGYMTRHTRRDFLQSTAITGMGMAASGVVTSQALGAKKLDASERLRLAVIGIHGRGGYHAAKWAARPDCEIAYLCDVEEPLFATYVPQVEKIQGKAPKT